MRICIIGTGSVAEDHVFALKEIGCVEFDTAVSRLQESAEKFAESFGFLNATTDFDGALLNGSFDTVIICSPSDLHAVQTEKALMAGKNVLAEIPISTNYADAEKIARLADEKKKTLMVAHTHRFYGPLMEAKRMIDEGNFHLHHLTGLWHFLRRENVNWKGRQRSWTDNLLWHHACHVVDIALWLFGTENVKVSGFLSKPSGSLGIPLDLNIIMRTDQGKIATISMSYNSKWPIYNYILVGEEDTLIFTDGKLENQNGVLCERQKNPVVLQDWEFINAVKEKRQPSINAHAVLPTMRILQRIQEEDLATD